MKWRFTVNVARICKERGLDNVKLEPKLKKKHTHETSRNFESVISVPYSGDNVVFYSQTVVMISARPDCGNENVGPRQ